MGGYGSGRTGGRPAVEDGLTLDLGRLLRQRNVIPGRRVSGSLIWTNTRTGERVGSIGYEAHLSNPRDSWMRLHYTTTRWRDDSKVASDYRVQLTTTRPPFGGLRWWFICPLTGRRAVKLHLPNGALRFASRRAYDLPYQSQRDSAMDRSHDRQRRLYRKLGLEYRTFDEMVPPRPKWMRHRTYDRIAAQLEAAIETHDAIFVAGSMRILARLDRRQK